MRSRLCDNGFPASPPPSSATARHDVSCLSPRLRAAPLLSSVSLRYSPETDPRLTVRGFLHMHSTALNCSRNNPPDKLFACSSRVGSICDRLFTVELLSSPCFEAACLLEGRTDPVTGRISRTICPSAISSSQPTCLEAPRRVSRLIGYDSTASTQRRTLISFILIFCTCNPAISPPNHSCNVILCFIIFIYANSLINLLSPRYSPPLFLPSSYRPRGYLSPHHCLSKPDRIFLNPSTTCCLWCWNLLLFTPKYQLSILSHALKFIYS